MEIINLDLYRKSNNSNVYKSKPQVANRFLSIKWDNVTNDFSIKSLGLSPREELILLARISEKIMKEVSEVKNV